MDIIKNIDFILTKREDKEIMVCKIDDCEYILDFTSDEQNKLRNLFMVILNKLKSEKIKLIYKKESSFNNAIFEQVAEEYVEGLNDEISKIYDKINENK